MKRRGVAETLIGSRAGSSNDILRGKSVGQLLAEGFEDLAAELKQNPSAIPAKFTCRQLSLTLYPQAYSPELVRKTRWILSASQTVFARFLGVSVGAVKAWEQGISMPRDSARRLMDEIRHDPPYWQARLRELYVNQSGKRSQRTRA